MTQSYLTKRPEATVHKRIRVIKQGNEPTDFQIVFAKWDPDMWLVRTYVPTLFFTFLLSRTVIIKLYNKI